MKLVLIKEVAFERTEEVMETSPWKKHSKKWNSLYKGPGMKQQLISFKIRKEAIVIEQKFL